MKKNCLNQEKVKTTKLNTDICNIHAYNYMHIFILAHRCKVLFTCLTLKNDIGFQSHFYDY